MLKGVLTLKMSEESTKKSKIQSYRSLEILGE